MPPFEVRANRGFKGRNAIAIRLVRLIGLLEARRYMPTWDVLARELGVCTRTVRRDVAALEEACWPMPTRRDWRLVDENEQAS